MKSLRLTSLGRSTTRRYGVRWYSIIR
jgi:hypothetical protein